MARFDLKAGNVIEILTPDEMQAQIDRVVGLLAKTQRPPNSFESTADGLTSADGVLSFTPIYRVPQGMVAVVHRINVESPSYNRANPLTTGYINFSINSDGLHDVFVGLPASPNGATLPATIVDSISAGQIIKEGSVIGAESSSLPDSIHVVFRVQVLLWETEG